MSDHGPLLNRAAFAHDRWAVGRLSINKRWYAFAPKGDVMRDSDDFPSQPEAFAYAYARAAQDDELDGFTADLAAWDEANVNDALRRRP